MHNKETLHFKDAQVFKFDSLKINMPANSKLEIVDFTKTENKFLFVVYCADFAATFEARDLGGQNEISPSNIYDTGLIAGFCGYMHIPPDVENAFQ